MITLRITPASLEATKRSFDLAIMEKGRESAEDVVRDVASFIESETKANCPVDTGFMREHTETRVSDDKLRAEVGWFEDAFPDRFYPPYVVFGTFKMPARDPFPTEPSIIARFGGGTVGG